MNKLNVIDRKGLLVVDSRLIAEELGIKHKNFLATIDKYETKMAESAVVETPAFETRELKTIQGNIITERWAWLTEPQANFLMTLSRNTEQVVNCKLKLVEAFERAKLILSGAIEDRVIELEQKLVAQSEAISQLQTQVQKLLPLSSDFMPPGWDAEVWAELPAQDKRHFRFIFRRRNFKPSNQGIETSIALPSADILEQAKQKQHSEVQAVMGRVTEEEKQRLETRKQEMLSALAASMEGED